MLVLLTRSKPVYQLKIVIVQRLKLLQVKLRPVSDSASASGPSGGAVDFEGLDTELDEHRRYFSQETRLRDLLGQIHDTAAKIWPSLDANDQEKVGHEQEFFNQLVKVRGASNNWFQNLNHNMLSLMILKLFYIIMFCIARSH